MEENFDFIGIPSNEPFEIEKEEPLKDSKKIFPTFPEGMPPEIQEMLNDKANLVNNLKKLLGEAFGGIFPEDIFPGNPFGEPKRKSEEEVRKEEENIRKSIFDSKGFGRHSFKSPEKEIEEEFKEYFGLKTLHEPFDISKLIKNNSSLNMIIDETREDFSLEEIAENIIPYLSTCFVIFSVFKEFIIIATFPENSLEKDESRFVSDTLPVYLVAFKNEKDDFSFFFPRSINNFERDKDGNIDFIRKEDGEYYFSIIDEVNDVSNPIILELSAKFYEAKKVLRRLSDVGTVKNSIDTSITKKSAFLRVGTLTFNDSQAALFMKIDNSLRDEENEIPFYLHFSKEYSEETLTKISNYFFKIDFNKNERINNEEIFIREGKAMINLDLRVLFDDLEI